MKVVVNRCFGGFGLSGAAYEKLAQWGVPVRKYVEQECGEDGCYNSPPENEGEVIFDRDLTLPGENDSHDRLYWAYKESASCVTRRYWDGWTRENRAHPLVVRAVEELGEAANGDFAELEVVEIPDGIEWEIDEYDGSERVAERHRTW